MWFSKYVSRGPEAVRDEQMPANTWGPRHSRWQEGTASIWCRLGQTEKNTPRKAQLKVQPVELTVRWPMAPNTCRLNPKEDTLGKISKIFCAHTLDLWTFKTAGSAVASQQPFLLQHPRSVRKWKEVSWNSAPRGSSSWGIVLVQNSANKHP